MIALMCLRNNPKDTTRGIQNSLEAHLRGSERRALIARPSARE
jgi:hypothetical protein